MTDEKRGREGNETTLKGRYGTWKLTVYKNIEIGATLAPSKPTVFLTLPRNTNLVRGIGNNTTMHYLYFLAFHSENYYWSFNSELHAYLLARNASHHQDIKLSVERVVDLNLRRQPCVEDPGYSLAECQQKCFMNRVNCSLRSKVSRETSERTNMQCIRLLMVRRGSE